MWDINIEVDKDSAARLAKRLQQIQRDLATKPRTELAKFLMEAGEELAKKVKKQPKEIMPVITGRLRSSVHAKHTPSDTFLYSDKEGNMFNGGLREPIKEGEEVVVGTNVEYAFKVDLRKGFMRLAEAEFRPILKREMDKLANKVVRG